MNFLKIRKNFKQSGGFFAFSPVPIFFTFAFVLMLAAIIFHFTMDEDERKRRPFGSTSRQKAYITCAVFFFVAASGFWVQNKIDPS